MAGAIYFRALARILAVLAKAGDGTAAGARHKLPIVIPNAHFAKLLQLLRDPKFRARHGLTKPTDA